MSEKGQGEESAAGTGINAPERTDGGSATETETSGGGSQADQTGPDQDPLGGLTPRDFPEPAQSGPDVTDESNPFDDVEFPTAEDNLRAMETGEPLELPRTKIRRPSPDYSPDPPQAGDPSSQTDDAEEARRQRGYEDAMRRRDAQREREQGPQPAPPDLDAIPEAESDSTTGSHIGPDEERPVLS